MDTHLEGCAACRDWLADWRALGAALGGASAHPDSLRLAAWAIDPDRLEPASWSEVESHLAACRDCALLVERTEQALAEARRTGRGEEPPARLRWLPALAAAALTAVVAGLLWLSLGNPVPAGPVPYLALTGTLRGDEARLALAAGDRLAVLALSLPPELGRPGEGGPPIGGALELEVVQRGAVVWRTRLGAPSVADAAATGRPLLVAVPAARLGTGQCALTLRVAGGPVLLSRAFAVERR